ncbi:4-oxalocrotonate tautomerase DmpI [Methanobrevibacter curvatus]|uniref:4-oxalocrotonate tautomerase n=1 Tax=Methanobrevibacter curvatus TaxID=49547 RepID=A0A162FJB7_9EURY|nr:4-oxalocrotonate tautomerase DmpI [Methanobrevibacter curvatus]KZX10830.1 4-oxalocrotonate tautomerase [Methanobrevibacter curvatus]
MPVVIIEGNPLDIDKKREYVKNLTKLTAETYNRPESTITVLIREIEPENVGVAGNLLADIINKDK